METYKLDRIYTWLSSAIGFNQQVEKKYFFDTKLRLFFNLGYNNGNYFPWTNQMPLSKANNKIVEEEIKFLKNDVFRFIEIIKSDIEFDVLPLDAAKDLVELEYKETQWKALLNEIESFLTKNNIQIQETYLIE